MDNIFNYRVVIIDEDGNISTYNKNDGTYEECINKYGREHLFAFTSDSDLAYSKNVAFKILDKDMLTIILPDKISQKQLDLMIDAGKYLENCIFLSAYQYGRGEVEKKEYFFSNYKNVHQDMNYVQKEYFNQIIESFSKEKTM